MDLSEVKSMIGVPAESSFSQLLYSSSARTLIVEMVLLPQQGKLPLSRLFYRREDFTQYKVITETDDSLTHKSPVVSPSSPILLFSVWNIDGFFQGINAFNLMEETSSRLISVSDLVPPVRCRRIWVSTLLNFDWKLEQLFVVTGIEFRSNIMSTRIEYHLSRIDLREGSVTLITKLDATFF